MGDDGRMITAKLPDALFAKLDEVSERIERTKSWIVREAVSQWLTEEERRCELTLEALNDVDEGRTHSHRDVLAMAEQRKKERRRSGS